MEENINKHEASNDSTEKKGKRKNKHKNGNDVV